MCEQMQMPSRRFLVQQAVLNAIDYWSPFYSRDWLKGWGAEARGALPKKFHDRIVVEFKCLQLRYGVEVPRAGAGRVIL